MAGRKFDPVLYVAAAVLAAAPPALAQSAEGTDAAASMDAAGKAAPTMLDTISITATRNPIEAFEYPGMVTVIGPERIRSLQASTPDDILRFVPNVEFTGGPRRTGEVPSIRGFSGSDVVILLDGARQNFNSGHDGRFFVDPSLLREVEVLRGPASALYGSGGTGGVIAFRTANAEDLLAPGETAGVTVSGGYHTVNREPLATVTAYGTPTGALDLLGSISKRDSGSIDLGNGEKLTNTDDDIIAGLAKAGFKLGDFHRIEGSFQRFSNDAEEPSNGQGLGGNDIVEKTIRTDTWRLAYAYDNPADNLLDLDVVAYHTTFQADELRLDNLGAGPEGELLKRDVETNGFRVDNRSRLTVSDSVSTTFTYGGEYYRDEQDGGAGSGERDGVPDADADFGGIFGQAEIAVARPFGVVPGDLLIVPGLRYDHYASSSPLAEDNKDEAVSPRLGVSYLPTDWLMLFGNYAQAFRAPSFDELYLTGVHFQIPIGPGITNRFAPNPDLDPQRTRTIEAGAGLDFQGLVEAGDRFQIKASQFWIKGEDFIDLGVTQPTPFVDCNPFIPGACDGTTTSINVPNAELWGSEVEASYESGRFLFRAGYSRIDGENEDTGAKLGVLTPDQFTLDAAVKLPEIDSLLGWRALLAASFDKVDDPAEERDGYDVHDIYFVWQPSDGPLRGFRLDLGVDNIFDEDYARVFTDATEPGRDFKILASYSLKW